MPATERRHYAGGAVATTITASINAAVTTFAITDPTGWPDGSTGPFYAEIDYDLSSTEKVKVTSRSGSTLNGVARGQDGTAAQGHTGANPKIRHVLTANDIDALNKHAADSAQAALDHPNFLTTTTHDVTARHTVGTVIPAAAPGNSAVGQAATAGVANSVARSDHQHGREGFGSPTASNPGDASSDGVATTVARSDHKHGREASGGTFQFGSSVAYTPSWQGTIGNGTLSGRYVQCGKLVWIWITLVGGTTTSWPAGTDFLFGLPPGMTAAVNPTTQFLTASVNCGAVVPAVAQLGAGASSLSVLASKGSGTQQVRQEHIDPLWPDTWGSLSSVWVQGWVEIA